MVAGPADGLWSHFINPSTGTGTGTGTGLHRLWSIGYAFFVLSQLNSHYRERVDPAQFYLSEVTMCLIPSHSDPKATNPGWLVDGGVCSPGQFPRHTALQDLQIAQHFLMADPSFSSNPQQQNTRKNILHNLYLIYFSRGRRVQNNLNWFSCSEFAKNAWTSCCN